MKKITEKRFNYYLEVLPPVIMGTKEVLTFLEKFDKNITLVEAIKAKKLNGLFVQGEGRDHLQIYGQCKEGFFYIGDTLKVWNCEDFRYPDSGNDMFSKIQAAITPIPFAQDTV